MIKSVQKATTILTVISDNKNVPITLKCLSEKTGIEKSTCSHIVSTLIEQGYVKRISHTKGYVLGPAAFCLSRYGRYDEDFVLLCDPVMNWLYNKTKNAVAVSVIQGTQKFIINYIDPEKSIYKDGEDIRTDDIYRTATGRIMLRNMDKATVADIFGKYGIPDKEHWPEAQTLEDLNRCLSEINKYGVLRVVNRKESDILCIGYGAAIFRYSVCKGALGMAVNIQKDELANFSATKEPEIEKYLKQAADEISRRLKFT